MALWSAWPVFKENILFLDLGEEVNTDYALFKLVTRVSVGICVVASVIVSLDTTIGTAIDCVDDVGKEANNAINEYCWIHGTKYLPEWQWREMLEQLHVKHGGAAGHETHLADNPFCNINSVSTSSAGFLNT